MLDDQVFQLLTALIVVLLVVWLVLCRPGRRMDFDPIWLRIFNTQSRLSALPDVYKLAQARFDIWWADLTYSWGNDHIHKTVQALEATERELQSYEAMLRRT